MSHAVPRPRRSLPSPACECARSVHPLATAIADRYPRPVRWPGVCLALLVNAVPVYGVLAGGWSAATLLVLYWLENLLAAVATCLRIAVHRSWTRKRGHYRGGQLGVATAEPAMSGRTFLGDYGTTALAFTLAHGVFVVGLTFVLAANHPGDDRWQLSLAQLRFGGAAVAALLGAGLAVDLPGLPAWSFARLRAHVQARLGRVLVLHLTIIFGMLAILFTESPFGLFFVLAGLKTLADVGGALASDAPPPARPPAWASRLVARVGGAAGHRAVGFDAEWRREVERAQRQAEADEEPA